METNIKEQVGIAIETDEIQNYQPKHNENIVKNKGDNIQSGHEICTLFMLNNFRNLEY